LLHTERISILWRILLTSSRNDILHRFWTTGRYEKNPVSDGQSDGCKVTLSPAMDILVSSNFERLLWFLAKGVFKIPIYSGFGSCVNRLYIEHAASTGLDDQASNKQASEEIVSWYKSLKSTGGFGPVAKDILENGRVTFESDRVSDSETVETTKTCFQETKYVLDPHSAVGFTAAKRSIARAAPHVHHISLSTAHPAKFLDAVTLALKDEAGFDFEGQVLPDEFKALSSKERRVTEVENSWEKVREIVKAQVEEDLKAEASG
jgi:threonine synthase